MNKAVAMSPSNPEILELFNMLESNRPQDVANIKSKFSDMFANTKDAWLVNGLIDYYQSTESMRSVDILTKVPVPHDKYLFDKLGEGLKGNWRSGALGLLGHVVRKQPLWLHKITKHPLFKDLLNLLKNEREVVPLMSGLLVLITLLPMIPTLISPFFQEIFEVFARVAAWESHRGGEAADGHREHLRLGLYCLFHNLYAMYPCNFFDFLKREYSKRENVEIFTHTVKPMLEAVRVHPLLITASKNSETEIARWKKMEHHDVLVECRRFSSEGARRQRGDAPDDGRFRSRCGTDVASLLEPSASPFQTSKSSNSTPNLTDTRVPPASASDAPPDPDAVISISRNCERFPPGDGGWFSLSEACDASTALSAPQTPLPLAANSSLDAPLSHTPVSQIPLVPKQQDGGSPPEAAIEATPENTPIKDVRQRFVFPNNSPAVRALGSRLSQAHPQAQQPSAAPLSQPPSPLKKESSPFGRGGLGDSGPAAEPQDAYHTQNRINRFLSDRSQQTAENFSSTALSPRKRGTGSPQKKISPKDASSAPCVPDSPVPLGTAAPVSGSTDWPLAKPKPRKDGVAFDAALPSSEVGNREDREVTEISKRGEVMRSASAGRDSDADGRSRGAARQQAETEGVEGDERWADDEVVCEGDGADCSERRHGLHMPQSASMLEFARQIAGFGFPGRGRGGADASALTADGRTSDDAGRPVRRRSRSCPETEPSRRRERPTRARPTATEGPRVAAASSPAAGRTEGTQTIDAWPPSYGLLFADALRNFGERSLVGDGDEGTPAYSPYEQVDRYVEILAGSGSGAGGDSGRAGEDVDRLRQQLRLLQLELLYERHRREVHAYRNRRLLGRARSNRATAEENAALKRQTALLRAEAEDLRRQIGRQRQNSLGAEAKHQENVKYWRRRLASRDLDTAAEREEKDRLAALLLEREGAGGDSSPETQRLHAALFDMTQRLHRATRKSETGDRLADCVKRMRRELVLCGEREMRLREALAAAPAGADAMAGRMARQCREQLVAAQTSLQAQACKVDYLQARESELEAAAAESEAAAQDLKRQLRLAKEEYGERLRAAEDKYQSVKRVNQRLEAHCLELLQRAPRSPHTASGFSPQSSPLSASLASSEGHGPPLGSRLDEIRNLQVIVDAHDAAEGSAPPLEDGG